MAFGQGTLLDQMLVPPPPPEVRALDLLAAAVAAQVLWAAAETAAQQARSDYAAALSRLGAVLGAYPLSGRIQGAEYLARRQDGLVVVSPAVRAES